MLNDLRGYLQLANGLSDVTAAKAKEIAASLITQGLILSTKAPDLMGQVQELADDLLSTSRNNREMLVGMVRTEVDRTVSRMGFVREDELAAVRRHVQRLEQEMHSKNGGAKPAAKKAAKKPAAKKAAKKPSPPATAEPVATQPVDTEAVVAEHTEGESAE
ncbi:MAG: polyhydroxyalkanoate synthesis protein PhaF [Actinomycetota bacterium]|nr:polyhydroxyalkanoate synthesis protein PhaF [Actinomycetota bacterium]